MKRKSLLLILPLVLLVSCGEKKESETTKETTFDSISNNSSVVNSETSKETISESDVVLDSTPEMVSNLLTEFVNSENYTVSQTFNNKEYKTKYTKNAVYDEWSEKGYIQLKSFDKEKFGENSLYNFTYNSNKEIELGVLVHNNSDGEVTVYHLASQLNYLLWLTTNDSSALNVNAFESDGNYIVSNNTTLLLTLSTLLGKESFYQDSTLQKVKFQVLNNSRLKLVLEGENTTQGIFDIATCILKDINTTEIDKVDNFINNYSFPTKTLTTANLTDLNSDSYTAISEFESEYVSGTSLKTQRNTIVSSNGYISMKSEYLTDNTSEYRLYGKGEDNMIHQYGIDAKNEQVDEKRSQSWESFAVLTSTFSDYSSFLSSDGVNFKYYGALGERLSYSLTYAEISDPVDISLKVENGLVSSLVVSYPLDTDEDSNEYYETATITLSKATTITKPEPFTEDSNTETIEAAFKKFETENFSYYEEKDTDSYCSEVFKTDDVLFYETYLKASNDDSINNIQTNHGYYKNSENLIEEFKVESDGSIRATAQGVEKSLFYFTNFSYNALAFTIEGDYIVPKTNVMYLPNYFFNDVFNVSSMIGDTLKMKLDRTTNTISEITFKANPNDVIHTIKMTFNYGDITLPKYLDLSKYESFTNPSTWLDESKLSSSDDLIKEKLEDRLGSTIAKSLPYYYDSDLSGSWQSDYVTFDSKEAVEIYNSSKAGYTKLSSYITNYKSLLTNYTKGTVYDNTYMNNYDTYTDPTNSFTIAIREESELLYPDIIFYKVS